MDLSQVHVGINKHKRRKRVGRGIGSGHGKTSTRGAKGQWASAGAKMFHPLFEGGQMKLFRRIPKRGFSHATWDKTFLVVNVGDIEAAAARGAFELPDGGKAKGRGKAKADAQVTINQDILRAVGLVRTLDKPMKILGNGELTVPLFVVADAFTASARAKIEAAGGTASVLEVPTESRKALGVEPEASTASTDEAVSTAGSTVAAEPAPAADPDSAETADAAAAADQPVVAEAADEATASTSTSDTPDADGSADADEAENASGDDA